MAAVAVTDEKAQEREHPRSWDWDLDGDELAGAYVELDEAPTAQGPKPLVIIEREGGERVTLWLFHEALRSRFAEEVAKRPAKHLLPGEPVLIFRGEWVESANGRKYRAYRVRFPASPKRSALEILGVPAGSAAGIVDTSDDTGEAPADDDGIPF